MDRSEVGEIVPEWLIGSMVRGERITKEGGRKGISDYEGNEEEEKENERRKIRYIFSSLFSFINSPTSVSVTVTILTSHRHPLTSVWK